MLTGKKKKDYVEYRKTKHINRWRCVTYNVSHAHTTKQHKFCFFSVCRMFSRMVSNIQKNELLAYFLYLYDSVMLYTTKHQKLTLFSLISVCFYDYQFMVYVAFSVYLFLFSCYVYMFFVLLTEKQC